MKKFIEKSFTAPSYWASYLINADSSGMDQDEIAAADRFIAWVDMGDPTGCDDIGFSHYCDANKSGYTLGADMSEYTFLKKA